MLFTSVLIGVCFLGYLAQTTGLCMVRGVREWRAGNREFLLAILFSGILAWVSALFSHFADIPLNFKIYAMNGWFLLGGVIFGLGTALNKGCGISTLGRLTRGDSRMFATIIGWLLGWTFLVYCSPNINLIKEPLPGSINYFLLIAGSLSITIWVCLGNKKRKNFGLA